VTAKNIKNLSAKILKQFNFSDSFATASMQPKGLAVIGIFYAVRNLTLFIKFTNKIFFPA
jgi:hypothetical protein